MERFVSYLRVSTERQGKSGLGLDGQRAAVAQHLNGRGTLVAEYVEVESGKDNDRPALKDALRLVKMTGATLIVAKLERLSRNVAFIALLQESAVKFICADNPTANELTIHILAAVAQNEGKAISERTRAALAAAKARGQRLGNPNGARALRGLGNGAAVAAVRAIAHKRAQDVLPIVQVIRAAGIATLAGIAAELNARGILTARGGHWHPTTVRNLLAREAP
jgi:DNA invertase Pin-like site-specific DNA recombinase